MNGIPDLVYLIYAIFDAPVQILISIFDFEILGINLWSTLRAVILILTILTLVRATKKD